MDGNDPAIIIWINTQVGGDKLRNLGASRDLFKLLRDENDLNLSVNDNSYKERFSSLRNTCAEHGVATIDEILKVAKDLFPDSVLTPQYAIINSNSSKSPRKEKQLRNNSNKSSKSSKYTFNFSKSSNNTPSCNSPSNPSSNSSRNFVSNCPSSSILPSDSASNPICDLPSDDNSSPHNSNQTPTDRFKYSKNKAPLLKKKAPTSGSKLDLPAARTQIMSPEHGEQLIGKISRLEHHVKFYEGRIKCNDKRYAGEYHFDSRSVNMTDRDYLREKDVVKFSVSGTVIDDEYAKEHEAYSIKLMKCSRRSLQEIVAYLDRLCKTNNSGEGSLDVLLIIVPAYFTYIINEVRDMPAISKLMQAHYQINKSATIHKVRLQTYNRFFSEKDLVRVWLPKWVSEADVEPSIKAKLGKLFVKQYLMHCPIDTLRCIVPLAEKVAPLLETRTKSERFLLHALRKTMDPLHSDLRNVLAVHNKHYLAHSGPCALDLRGKRRLCVLLYAYKNDNQG